MIWNKVKSETTIPINTDLLITDGFEVFAGFFDSHHEWRMINRDLDVCDCIDFYVTHWMEYPFPPCLDNID